MKTEKCLICLIKEEIPGKERHAKYPVWKALQIGNLEHIFGGTGLGQAEKINRFFAFRCEDCRIFQGGKFKMFGLFIINRRNVIITCNVEESDQSLCSNYGI